MTIKQTDEITPVLFRIDRIGDFKGGLTAIFPCDPSDLQGNGMSCFAHVGQHSGCTLAWFHTTRAAIPEEYAALRRELESAPYGYRFKIYRRIQPWMHDTRRAAATFHEARA